MRKYVIGLILCIACNRMVAQNFVWGYKFGNTKSDKATATKVDGFGNVYVTGYFSTNITLGSNALPLNYTGNSTSKEVFLAKFDSTGACLWAKSAGNSFDDRSLGMDVDSIGNVTITGTFWESGGVNFSGNFITGSGFGGGDQCFVVRYDPNGNYQWGRFVCSNSGDDQGLDLAMDKWGNTYVVGFMSGDDLYVNGNTVTAVNANQIFNITGWYKDNCYWLAKFDASGTPKWARTFARQPYDPVNYKYVERDIAVCVDDSDGIYVGGGFEKFTTFNGVKDTATYGGYDIFVLKYDSAGNYQWHRKGGSDKDDWINGITYDEQGHIYIAGEHRDSLWYDTVLIKNYNKRDAFVMKLDAKTGKPIWGKRAGGPLGNERANDVYADANCNVYVAGDIQAGAKFNDELFAPTGGSVQSFVARMSPAGKFLWASVGGGADSNDRCNSVIKGIGSQLYICGYFRTPATFGPNINLTSSGSSDAYLIRLNDSLFNKSADIKFTRPTDTVVCPGGSIYLAIPKNNYFEINPKNGVVPNADTTVLTITPTSNTTYTITGMVGDFCVSYDTMVFSVLVDALPDAQINISPNGSLLIDTVLVTATSVGSGGVTYAWYYNGNNIGSGNSIQQVFDSDSSNHFGTHCYTLVVANSEGCADTAVSCIELSYPSAVGIPSAFTPGGDGLNESFKPIFLYKDINQLSRYIFRIYDRYGAMVFETKDFSKGWTGNYPGGQQAAMDTYMYTIEFLDPTKQLKRYSGEVTLIR